MFIFCCVKSTDITKALVPIYSLFELTCIYMEAMATTSESATASEILQCGKVTGQHTVLVL